MKWIIPDREVVNLPKIDLTISALNLSQHRAITNTLCELVSRIRSFKTVVWVGTGGSSLGAQVFAEFADEHSPQLHFLENIDPITFQKLVQSVQLDQTFFIFVSKSGTTPETLMQMHLWCDLGPLNAILITENKQSPMKELAEKSAIPCFEHPSDIGGRFSCFSIVGMLAAMVCGLDSREILDGAEQTLNLFKKREFDLPISYVWNHVQSYSQVVTFCYIDKLAPLVRWHQQLWAESLGKEGKGTTPIQSKGAVDQHSQLQLYLDGPNDKIFTFLFHPGIQNDVACKSGIFKHKTLSDLIRAEQLATSRVLEQRNRPIRIVEIEEVSPKMLGELMMFFILETIVIADLMNINCFDQPAVEEGKRIAMELLKS